MLFVYDFYPGAETLMSKHFNSNASTGNPLLDALKAGSASSRPARSMQPGGRMTGEPPPPPESNLLPEADIWNYIIQLTSALRGIHGAGLACRTLDPTKILVINNRILLNCVGIFDVLTFDPNSSNPGTAMAQYQQ